ncbi:lysylphosphatidylglycerol synthase transmembrane domain-containing protein [Segetibacter koreensis]|uniref:lysylphosphatidylglycerol synthase transmembrane domain-containing protein n=1 Tax=Segetibacter koreensis TaxID=398037 RepID=UPI000364A733|nr:lysylphosphatidylglycerol synthase transmembrane domain-containing protein [Segetibacter koreensis]
MTPKRRKTLFAPSRIVFYILSFIVFYLAVHYVGKLEDIEALLLQLSPGWLLVALGSQIATYVLNSLILHTLLPQQRGTINFGLLFKISVVIMFVNQALPTGGVSGNGYVFNQLVKRGVSASRAFTALVLESICYYIAFLMLLLIFYCWYLHYSLHANHVIIYTAIAGFVFYIFLGIVMIVISSTETISFVLNKLGRFGSIKRYIEKANLPSLKNEHEASMKEFVRNKKATVLAILLQLSIIFCDVITAYALLKGFHVGLAFSRIILGLLLSLVIGALPLSPGSLIAYESAMTYFYTTLGVPLHAALIVTLLYRFFTFWLPIPVGLLLYRNLQRK